MSRELKDDQRIYLYCLIRSPQENPFQGHGLHTKGIGGQGTEVYSLHFLDMAFVVSDCAELDYETSRENTLCHEKVVEEVMDRGFSPIPVRFGTVATASRLKHTEQRIRNLLRRRFGELQGLLRDMEDKVELGLKAYWRKSGLFSDIVAENREIRLLRDRIASNPRSGMAWRNERIKLGTLVNNAIEAKRDVEAERLVKALRPSAHDYRTSKVSTDLMILNSAYLVYKSRVDEFDARVDELDQEYGQRIKFSYVGPVPPFNFVELAIHWEEEEREDEREEMALHPAMPAAAKVCGLSRSRRANDTGRVLRIMDSIPGGQGRLEGGGPPGDCSL